ncbi:MAG: SlyX family protein [Planctomycetota bacterium]
MSDPNRPSTPAVPPSATPADAAREQRLMTLEIQLAHQQRAWEQLNEVVVEHTKTILRLQGQLARLENQLRDVRQGPPEQRDLLAERPPHY